jgi:hypothetical protein
MNIVTVTLDNGKTVSYDANIPTVDDGLAFYLSQLSQTEAKIYESKYRNIVYQDFVPVDTSQPEWVDEVSYISYDAVTMGKFIGANAKDLPQSDLNASKSTIPVFYGGNSYGYSLDELRKSQQLRIPLDVTKGRMTLRGFQEHAQRVAFNGDSDRGITGLFNNANVALTNAAINFTSATGQDIVSYLNGILISVWQNSAETHLPNVLAIPSDDWAIISERRMADGTDTTILEFLKKNNLYTGMTGAPLTIKPNYELKTAGTGGVSRYMAYEMNDDNLVMHMPMPWRSLAPQPVGLRIEVPCEYKFGGVEFRYPGCAAYKDNVA